VAADEAVVFVNSVSVAVVPVSFSFSLSLSFSLIEVVVVVVEEDVVVSLLLSYEEVAEDESESLPIWVKIYVAF